MFSSRNGHGYGHGYGNGDGFGSGYGHGYGDADGDGYGHGYSNGNGHGHDYGYGDGFNGAFSYDNGGGYGYSDRDVGFWEETTLCVDKYKILFNKEWQLLKIGCQLQEFAWYKVHYKELMQEHNLSLPTGKIENIIQQLESILGEKA